MQRTIGVCPPREREQRRNLFEALEDNQSLSRGAVQIAAPDLNRHGLSFAAAAARLCLQLKIDDVVLPNLGTGTLTVVAGVTLGGGPLVFSRRPVSSTVRTLPTPVQGARPSGRPTPPDG